MYEDDNSAYLDEPIRTGRTLTFAEWYDVLGGEDLQDDLAQLPASTADRVEPSGRDYQLDLLYGMGLVERTGESGDRLYRRSPAGDQFIHRYQQMQDEDALTEDEIAEQLAETVDQWPY